MTDEQLHADLTARLSELCGTTVPGASLAFAQGGEIVHAAHGVTSLTTNEPVVPGTLFQVGSLSKVYTATLVMMLVDEGVVKLDTPVRTYLPWFKVADAHASETVTVRHLLTHSSGFEGDDFTDTGRGDDALRLYVERLAQADQIHPVGRMFSYCNSGFSVLGCIVEQVTGLSWDEALQARLAGPLGIELATLPEEAIMRSHAVGHLDQEASEDRPTDGHPSLRVAPMWAPPRSVGPAGTICSTAKDVLEFGAMHARGGLTPDGVRILSSDLTASMQQEQIRLLDPWMVGPAWGLGWILTADGVVGHDGATFGQYAFYRLHPTSGTALVLLTNGPGARGVFEALYDEFFAPASGVPPLVHAKPPAVPAQVTDLSRFVGTYERAESRLEVTEAHGALSVAVSILGPYAELASEPEVIQLLPFHDDTTFVSAERVARSGVHATAHFVIEPAQERASWIHLGGRATPRRG